MQNRRTALADDRYINGTELATKLGPGRTALGRWIRAGKLPKMEKSVGEMLLFDRKSSGGRGSQPVGTRAFLAETPKTCKIMETAGDGRQREVIWTMSD
jgi:predicted DNA-binding transcriptional regulator AlpA